MSVGDDPFKTSQWHFQTSSETFFEGLVCAFEYVCVYAIAGYLGLLSEI